MSKEEKIHIAFVDDNSEQTRLFHKIFSLLKEHPFFVIETYESLLELETEFIQKSLQRYAHLFFFVDRNLADGKKSDGFLKALKAFRGEHNAPITTIGASTEGDESRFSNLVDNVIPLPELITVVELIEAAFSDKDNQLNDVSDIITMIQSVITEVGYRRVTAA